MATRRADKYTVNTKMQVKFSDFTANFDANPSTGDLYRNINDLAIKESLKNIILTEQGERPFQPTLGSTIRNMMFDILDDKTVFLAKQAISTAVTNHEPRVVLQDLSITPDDEHNTVSITIFYTTINSPGQIQDLTVTLLTRVR